MSAESGSGYTIGFVGDRAVYQILPQPIHAPVIWKICDPRGNLIGSAASFRDAKLWCEKRPRRGSSSNGAKIYSKDPIFGLLGVKNRSQTAKSREHCVKYMREIRIERKFCSCRAVFHAVNDPSIVGVGPVWRNY
jgi:hypothetical protein